MTYTWSIPAGKEINEEMTKSAKKASNKTVVTTAE